MFIAAVWVSGIVVGFVPAVTVLTIAGFAAAVMGLAKPSLGVFGVGILCTLDSLTRVFLLTGGLLRWNSFNYLMIAALLFAPASAAKLSDIHTRILLAFAFLLTLQLTFTPDLYSGLHTMLNVLSPFGILLYFSRTGYDQRVIAWLGTICGVLGAAGGLVYFLQIDELAYMNKNAWSAFPLTAIFSICLAYTIVRPELQLRLGTLAAVNAVWVFLSGSRGGMFIGVFCLIYLFFRTRKTGDRLVLFAAAPALASLLLGVFAAVSDTSMHRLTMLFDSERDLESRTSGRSDLYIAGWRMFQENPLGVGTGGFPKTFAAMSDRDLSFAGTELGAHSGWVKVMTENGVLGIVVLAAFVISFAVAGVRSRDANLAAAGLLVTVILATAFFSREFHSKGLWFAAAGYVAMTKHARGTLGQCSTRSF
jgi:O-antigen ligase